MQLPEALMRIETNKFDEIYFPEIVGNLFFQYPALSILKDYYADAFNDEAMLYLMIGSDSGHLPFYLYERFRKGRAGRRFLIFEFEEVSKHFDYSKLPEWIHVVSASQTLDILSSNSHLNEFKLARNVSFLVSVSLANIKQQHPLFPWKESKKQECINLFSNTASDIPFETESLFNWSLNLCPISHFRDCYKDKSALIIGAGPSVDEHLEWIQENQSSLIIFAAARTIKRLKSVGIDADFIVSVDPSSMSYDNSKHFLVEADPEKTILLHSNYIHRRLLSQWRGKSVYLGSPCQWLPQPWNSDASGPTVMHTSLFQAGYLGCSKIFLVGVDLCYREDKTHMEGSAENEMGKFFVQNLAQVTTYKGEKASTSQAFLHGVSALTQISRQIKEMNPSVKIYNLSQNAAKAAGIEYMSTKDCCLDRSQPKHDFQHMIHQQLEIPLSEQKLHMSGVVKEVKRFKNKVVKTLPILKKAIQFTEKLDENTQDIDQLPNFKNKVERSLTPEIHYYLINIYKDHALLKEIFRESENESQMTIDEIKHRLLHLFLGLEEVCQEQLILLNEALKVAEFRLKELSPKTRPIELSKYWQGLKEYNRASLWIERFNVSLASLTPKEQEIISDMKALFEQDILNTETDQKAYLESIGLSFEELYRKVISAYDHQDIEEMKQIAKQGGRLSLEQSESLRVIIDAVISELQQEEGVFEYYQTALSKLPNDSFLLRRALHFAMQGQAHDQVLMYLEKLVSHSIDYMVPYSDYLAMLGQDKFAFQLLYSYLQQKPEKVKSWLRLSELALKLGSQVDAKIALEKALELEPDNQQIQNIYTKFV